MSLVHEGPPSGGDAGGSAITTVPRFGQMASWVGEARHTFLGALLHPHRLHGVHPGRPTSRDEGRDRGHHQKHRRATEE